MPDSTPGALEVVPVAEGRELPALLTALKAHLEQFGPDEVVVLSPFGEQSSLVGRFLAREPATKEERQLRELLAGERAVAWRSIFTGKGLDAAAVVLTDITPDAAAWADERRLSWNDLLYVGMTRAECGCTVLRSEGAPWSGELDAELGATGSTPLRGVACDGFAWGLGTTQSLMPPAIECRAEWEAFRSLGFHSGLETIRETNLP
jgi:hypothetical protein